MENYCLNYKIYSKEIFSNGVLFLHTLSQMALESIYKFSGGPNSTGSYFVCANNNASDLIVSQVRT